MFQCTQLSVLDKNSGDSLCMITNNSGLNGIAFC